MMNRLEKVREAVNEIILSNTTHAEIPMAFLHLYGVSDFCSMLAMKRGLDTEVCAVAGMLHDIWTYKTGDSREHAKHGSVEARNIMSELGIFTDDEIDSVSQMISKHSKKRRVHDMYDELLKDADTLHHYFYNTSLDIIKKEKERLVSLLDELRIENSLE